MKHRNRIPLNLQYFAESTGGEGTGGTGGEGTGDAGGTGAGIDYSKIQSMIDKGTQQKEKAILKSYFEQQGLTGDEMETAIAQFKESKASEAKKQQDDIANMQKENETLKAQILQGKVDAETVRIAGELNVTPANVPYVQKLADLKGCVNDKGEIDSAKVKEAIEKVLEDVPAFKAEAKQSGFTKVGAGGSGGGDAESELEKSMKSIMGLS